MIQHRLDLKRVIWNGLIALYKYFGMIGYLTIVVFVTSWIVAAVVYRIRGYDRIGARISL